MKTLEDYAGLSKEQYDSFTSDERREYHLACNTPTENDEWRERIYQGNLESIVQDHPEQCRVNLSYADWQKVLCSLEVAATMLRFSSNEEHRHHSEMMMYANHSAMVTYQLPETEKFSNLAKDARRRAGEGFGNE